MGEIRTLLLLELRSLYGINKFLHTKDPKAKSRYRLLGIVWLFLIIMAAFYVGGLVYGLCSLGLSDIVPAYLVVLSSILIVAFGLFTAGNRIFGQKGYDIIASMPLKTGSVVISRFLGLYAADLMLTLVIMLPGIVVYGLHAKPAPMLYPIAFIAALFIPAIPIAVSTLFGTLIMAVSSRMKSKSMVQSVLMVLVVVGIVVGSFGIEGVANSFTTERITEIAQNVGDAFHRVYPPAVWLNEAMMHGKLLYLGLFILISAAVMALTAFIAAKCFHAIVRRLRSFTAKHNYKIGTMGSHSLLRSLCFREAKRYFSSSIYVTNTIIGPIMGAIMAIALCIVGLDKIENALPFEMDIPSILPFVFSAVFCMMNTTSTAISMEGKQFWVAKSLPIPTKALLDSKILLNLSLMLPFYVVAEVAFIIAVKPNALQLVWLLLVPACIMLFSVVLGITVNLKFHSFDWDKEETVVKQSLSAALGDFSGFLLAVVLGIVVFMVPPQYGSMVKGIVCLLLLVASVLLYRKNNTAVLSEL